MNIKPDKIELAERMAVMEKAIRFHRLMERKAELRGKMMIAAIARRNRKKIACRLAELDRIMMEKL